MYSVVLMAALTTGGETPAFGRHGCHGCYGCYGCCGGCWGCYGCYGCYGCHGCWGCCGGCYGCGGCWGGGYYGGGHRHAYAGTISDVAYARASVTPRDAATIVVDLPSDARLFVDDQPTASTSPRRVFQSPSLGSGDTYSYTLRAEVQRDGKTYQQSKKIFVRAGEETKTAFSELGIMQTARASR